MVERVAAHHAFLRQQSNLLPDLRWSSLRFHPSWSSPSPSSSSSSSTPSYSPTSSPSSLHLHHHHRQWRGLCGRTTSFSTELRQLLSPWSRIGRGHDSVLSPLAGDQDLDTFRNGTQERSTWGVLQVYSAGVRDGSLARVVHKLGSNFFKVNILYNNSVKC